MMMGYGFGWLMLLYALLCLFGVWGFAYIIWVLSAKETGSIKMIGQIISIVVAVLIVLILISGSIYGGRMMSGGMGMGMGMMGSEMSKERMEMMKKMMMNNPEYQKMMMEWEKKGVMKK